jgi:hypothetical protein
MILKLDGFCADVKRAEEGKCLYPEFLSEYLWENLFLPYISGEVIPLDSLDYDRFTLSDMKDIMDYLSDAEEIETKLGTLQSMLVKCEPVARKLRAFC